MTFFECISVIAIVISTAALVWDFRLNRKVKKQEFQINRQLVENQKKAIVFAELHENKKDNLILKISNRGEATAKNVRFISADMKGVSSGMWVSFPHGLNPRSSLLPGDFYEAPVFNLNRKELPLVKLIWDDESGKNNEITQLLSLPV